MSDMPHIAQTEKQTLKSLCLPVLLEGRISYSGLIIYLATKLLHLLIFKARCNEEFVFQFLNFSNLMFFYLRTLYNILLSCSFLLPQLFPVFSRSPPPPHPSHPTPCSFSLLQERNQQKIESKLCRPTTPKHGAHPTVQLTQPVPLHWRGWIFPFLVAIIWNQFLDYVWDLMSICPTL